MAPKQPVRSSSPGVPNAHVADIHVVLKSLKSRGSQANIDGMARYAIQSAKVFGVSVAELRRMAKQLGRNHQLALELWDTGWHEARMLAACQPVSQSSRASW